MATNNNNINNAIVPVREGSSMAYQCPLLTATNYTSWAIKMESFMDAQGIWDAIEPPEGVAMDVKIVKKARAFIFQALPEDILLQVAGHKEAKDVWNALRVRYLGADRVQQARIQTLNREFELLSMKESDSIDDFASKIGGIVSKFRTLGSTMDEKVQVKKLLNSAPIRFLPIVATIEQYSDLNTMAFEEVVGRLKAYEERVKPAEPVKDSSGQLLLTRTEWHEKQKTETKQAGRGRGSSPSDHRGRGRGCGRFNGRGRGGRHPSNNSRRPDQEDNNGRRDRRNLRCYNCDNLGHFSAECRAPKKADAEVNLVREEDEPTLLMAMCLQETVLLNEEKVFPKVFANDNSEQGTWYLDNGASNHMTGQREFFSELDTKTVGCVRFGDGSTVNIEGKGSVILQCKNGDQRVISSVYYIPDLCNNILSLGQLTEVGCKVVMEDGFLWLYERGGSLLLKVGRSRNRLYKIKLQVTPPVCLHAKLDETAWLWHARLGHLNFGSLNEMSMSNMAHGIPKITHSSQICEACMAGKHKRSPFPSQAQYRSTKPLELIHADICGPISPATPAGNRYFLLLVDDFSRFMWVYMLKSKDQAHVAFKKFKPLVEQESGLKIKALRTDRGGEFISNNLVQLCDEAGINRYLTAPYTPQQNGVVERRNQSILGTTRSILKAMQVPRYMWGEGVRHAVYLLNRVSTKALDNKTPYEAWKGRKPNVEHLKVFGCLAHVKVPAVKLTKLDDRSEPMMYLGVEPSTKAYRCYDPRKRKIVVSRDVRFEETKGWNWLKDDNEPENSWIDFTVEDESSPEVENGPVESSEQAQNASDGPNSPTVLPASPVSSAGPAMFQGPSITNQGVFGSPLAPTGPATNASGQSSSGPNHNSPNSPFNNPEQVENSSSSSDADSVPRSTYDDTPAKGFRSINDVYGRTHLIQQTEFERLLLLKNDEPVDYKEAKGNKDWEKAMEDELDSIERNNTWRLVELPKGIKPIGLKWVFKTKKDAKGEVTRYKARLVAKGYVQKHGIDYDEVFAPVTRLETVRLIIALAARGSWEVHHLDVKTAFLYGDLKEDVFVSQPEGFEKPGKEHFVYKLRKALYGLKQAPRCWNAKLDGTLQQLGFKKCPREHAVYKRDGKKGTLIIGVYVDDLIITGPSVEEIAGFKDQMKGQFEMSNLGLLKYYLGIEVQQSKDDISLKQSGYAIKILKQANMWECNPTKFPMDPGLRLTKEDDGESVDATEYRRLIGCLRYLTHTRPDISYAVGVASRFMESPKVSHMQAVKQVLRYLKGTVNFGICYHRNGDAKLTGYSDSSHATDRVDGRSTTGMVFYYGGGPVAWCSQKQNTVALSSCEAEFMAATATACQAVWLKGLLEEMIGQSMGAITIRVDNKSAIQLIKNPVFHGRSKHIDTKYHFIRECVEKGLVTIEHVSGEEQKADILTKALPRVKFIEMRELLGVEDLIDVKTGIKGVNVG